MEYKALILTIVLLGTVGLVSAVPSVQLVDTNAINYLNVFDYNTSVHNNLTGLQGGTTNEYYHLTSAAYTYLIANLYDFDINQTASSKWSLTGHYLYNNSGSLDINETYLNATIDARNTGADENTNCSEDGSCPLIVYSSNTSWVTENQQYNSTEDMFNAVDNGTFLKSESDPVWTSDKGNYYTSAQTDSLIVAANDSVKSWVLLKEYYNHVNNLTAVLNSIYVSFSNIVSIVGNWSADKSSYYTSTETDTEIENANISMKNYADSTFITQADEGNLNVNSSGYWDNLNTPSDINAGDITDDGTYLTTAVESLSSADDYISVDTPTGIVEIDFNESKLSSVYYNATTSNLVAGTIDGGTLNNTRHSDANYDGITMNFSEASGSPGLDVRVNFTVDSFNRIVFRYKTSELKGDYPLRQLWDYNNSVWEDYHSVGEATSFSLVTQPVFDNEAHVQDGVVQLRLYKASSGNTNNHYYIDWVAMVKGFGTPSGVEVDPLSFHKNANIDNIGYNITTDTFKGNLDCSNITGATSDLCTLIDTDTNLTEADITAFGFTKDTDTNASTACSGTTTYLDGEGNCDDISSIYAPAGYGDEWNKTYADTLYRAESWDNFTGIPHVTPSNGDVTHFSWADEIYDWVIGLGYSTTTGTVTNIATGNGLTGGPITTTGTISIDAKTSGIGNYSYWDGNSWETREDVDTDTTYTNASFDMSQLANTGNVDTGNYNLTVNGLHIDKINSTHHKLWS